MLVILRAWILLSALLCASGWLLSAFHQLNRIGYGIVFTLAGIATFWWWRGNRRPIGNDLLRALHKLKRRFKRLAPLLFLTLTLLALVGGALYVHTNPASDGYRIPRVLHWLGRGQWYWIPSADNRMNVVACGFEWLSAPLILFTYTDRLIFLINLVSYLLLPGLIFGVFIQLKIRPRVAWWWMWLLSSGWCFAIQASSDVNDSSAAVYALAAVYFALRGRESKRAADLWLSMLAAGLLTGIKQTNIPLVLLWLIAVWPSVRLMLARPWVTAFVAVISVLVSAVPVTFFNFVHCGNWQGLPPGLTGGWSAGTPFWKIVGNMFSVPLQNLLPPFFPWSNAWDKIMSHFLRTPLGGHFAMLERFGHLGMGISEWNAGIGLGICTLMLVSLWRVRCLNGTIFAEGMTSFGTLPWLLRVTPWVLLLVFMAEICSDENARLLSAYYVFLFPLLLASPKQELLVRRLWWQKFGLSIVLLTVLMLVVSRDRPLFPARTIFGHLRDEYPHSKFLSALWLHYAWPSSVASVDIKLREAIPPHERVVGYATVNGFLEPGLWFPLGQRRVKRVLPNELPKQLVSSGIHYVFVEDQALEVSKMTITEWTQKYNGQVVDQWSFFKDPYHPPGHIYLVRLHQNASLPPRHVSRGGFTHMRTEN